MSKIIFFLVFFSPPLNRKLFHHKIPLQLIVVLCQKLKSNEQLGFRFILERSKFWVFNAPQNTSLTCLLNVENYPTFINFRIVKCMTRFWLAMNPICGRSINKTTDTVWRCSMIVENVETRRRCAVDERNEKLLRNFCSLVARKEFYIENGIARVVRPRRENIRNWWIKSFRFVPSNPLQNFIKFPICCRFIASANSWSLWVKLEFSELIENPQT